MQFRPRKATPMHPRRLRRVPGGSDAYIFSLENELE
jgi:hypothetical protein